MSPTNKFHFNYQPIYANNKIISYEALLRLKNKNIKIEPYLSSIKDKPKFDIEIIKSIILDTKNFNDKFSISINISILSLESSCFVSEVIKILKNKNIILEITEHDSTKRFKLVKSNIEIIKNKTGIKFALDDFGKGCSNTESLLSLPIDIIKIDRSLIKDIVNDYISYAILKTKILKITNILNKIVIVEGVENKHQLELINLIGNCGVQGFLYSKPLERDIAFSNKPRTIEFKPHHNDNFIQKLDKLIYDITLNKKIIIEHESFNNIFLNKENSVILDDAKNMVKRLSEQTLLPFSSLLYDCDNFIIIRNDKGTAIYNNQNHIKFMNKDFVGINVNEIYEKYPDYRHCIDLDKKLLSSKSNFLVSNESICIGHNIECFQTFRQKICSFNHEFIVCTVYRDNTILTMRKDSLTSLYGRETLTTPYAYNFNSLIFIDLNGFKAINDKHGHKVGDLCLKQASDILSKNLRDDDLIIRYGGDEFIILTMMQDAELISRRISEINNIFTDLFLEKNLDLSFSYGISKISSDITKSISDADSLMYINKRKSKEIKISINK